MNKNQTEIKEMLPDQGQLVEVRHRRWLATEINKTHLAADVLGKFDKNFHLVTLTSVEDDTLQDELQVIWELEKGSRVFEKTELPEVIDFDDPHLLDAFLDAVRWGASSTTDKATMQAPFRSGIDIEDYQLDPLVRAIQMPRVSY